jgi:hypothetical protein
MYADIRRDGGPRGCRARRRDGGRRPHSPSAAADSHRSSIAGADGPAAATCARAGAYGDNGRRAGFKRAGRADSFATAGACGWVWPARCAFQRFFGRDLDGLVQWDARQRSDRPKRERFLRRRPRKPLPHFPTVDRHHGAQASTDDHLRLRPAARSEGHFHGQPGIAGLPRNRSLQHRRARRAQPSPLRRTGPRPAPRARDIPHLSPHGRTPRAAPHARRRRRLGADPLGAQIAARGGHLQCDHPRRRRSR